MLREHNNGRLNTSWRIFSTSQYTQIRSFQIFNKYLDEISTLGKIYRASHAQWTRYLLIIFTWYEQFASTIGFQNHSITNEQNILLRLRILAPFLHYCQVSALCSGIPGIGLVFWYSWCKTGILVFLEWDWVLLTWDDTLKGLLLQSVNPFRVRGKAWIILS